MHFLKEKAMLFNFQQFCHVKSKQKNFFKINFVKNTNLTHFFKNNIMNPYTFYANNLHICK